MDFGEFFIVSVFELQVVEMSVGFCLIYFEYIFVFVSFRQSQEVFFFCNVIFFKCFVIVFNCENSFFIWKIVCFVKIFVVNLF